MKDMFSEFKEFLMRGNVVDLAVGVVIGSAFTAIVTQVVDGLITPLVALFVSLFTNGADLESTLAVLEVSVNGVTFDFGSVVSAIITFIITGFVLFFVVRGINRLQESRKKGEPEIEEVVATAEDYLSEIRDLLRLQSGLPPKEEEE